MDVFLFSQRHRKPSVQISARNFLYFSTNFYMSYCVRSFLVLCCFHKLPKLVSSTREGGDCMNTQTFNHTPHKCRKKLLSWLLVLCLCAGLLPVRVFAEQSIPCLEFALAIPTANSIPTADAAILTPGVLPTESFSVSWYKDSPDGDGPVHLKKNII